MGGLFWAYPNRCSMGCDMQEVATMIFDKKRVSVSMGWDVVLANAMTMVAEDMGLGEVPIRLLSRYAGDVSQDACMFVDDTLMDVHVETSWERASDGTPSIAEGTYADGMVSVDGSKGGMARLADGVSIGDLQCLAKGMTEGDAPLRRILSSDWARRRLLTGMSEHLLGTRAIGRDGIPAGRPLVLVDIDDCLNVFRYDAEWYRHDPLPEADIYDIDMEGAVSFPTPLVGRHSFSRDVPERIPVRWSSELVRDIGNVAEDTGAVFVWMTSWHQYSKAFEDALWPDGDSPFIGYLPWSLRGLSDDGRHGKHLAIAEFLCGDEDGWDEDDFRARRLKVDVPCVVVIDDKGASFGEDFFVSALPRELPGLTVAPDVRYGVSRPQWSSVREFLARHAAT